MPAILITSILKRRPASFLNNFEVEITSIENASIIFLFAGWSQSIIQLSTLNDSLKDFPQIKLYIFNIDHGQFWNFADKNKIHSDGWGETFWVRNGKIVTELKKYDGLQIGKLIANNLSIL